jgi:hypothetical protein
MKQFWVASFALLALLAPAFATAQSPIQIALFNPVQIVPEDEAIRGVRLNILYGKNTWVRGLDVGLVNHTTDGISKGIQAGLINLAESDFLGWQPGVVNIIEGEFLGLQGGFWAPFNQIDGGEGAQIGIVNVARDMSGFMLGLVNYAENMYGLQIGLVNIIENKDGFPFFPIVNWSF